MPRFKLTQDSFFAPELLKAGTVINYDGPLGPHFEPLDAEGEAALKAWYTANPHAGIAPFEELEVKGANPPPPVEVVAPPLAGPADVDIGTLAQPGRASPGLSDGGKAR